MHIEMPHLLMVSYLGKRSIDNKCAFINKKYAFINKKYAIKADNQQMFHLQKTTNTAGTK